jgi:acetyltransferase
MTEAQSHPISSCFAAKYSQQWQCRDGTPVLLRPIRAEDETIERELLTNMSDESSRGRFFQVLNNISSDMVARFCNIDHNREMAFIAEFSTDGKKRNVGVGRLIIEPTGNTAEFAVLVADDFQHKGLGLKLFELLIDIAREKQLSSIYGIVLNDNVRMLKIADKFGSKVVALPDFTSGVSKVILNLR